MFVRCKSSTEEDTSTGTAQIPDVSPNGEPVSTNLFRRHLNDELVSSQYDHRLSSSIVSGFQVLSNLDGKSLKFIEKRPSQDCQVKKMGMEESPSCLTQTITHLLKT